MFSRILSARGAYMLAPTLLLVLAALSVGCGGAGDSDATPALTTAAPTATDSTPAPAASPPTATDSTPAPAASPPTATDSTPAPTASPPGATDSTPAPTASPPTASDSTPAPAASPPTATVQQLALLENYAATSFFPDTVVVLQNLPVRIYFSRLHSEHVNRFSIEPFLESSDVIFPGTVAVFEFVPDRVGTFRIRNRGHGFEATLIVVVDDEAAAATWADLGRQQVALIYREEDERVFPSEVQVFVDIPVLAFNLALEAEHQVSVPPFYVAQAPNVGPGEISTFEFTPDGKGSFVIGDELHGLQATLLVR